MANATVTVGEMAMFLSCPILFKWKYMSIPLNNKHACMEQKWSTATNGAVKRAIATYTCSRPSFRKFPGGGGHGEQV